MKEGETKEFWWRSSCNKITKVTLLLFLLIASFTLKAQQRSERPTAQLGHLKDSIVSIKQILRNPQLLVVEQNARVSNDFTVIRFDLKVIEKEHDLDTPPLRANSSNLTSSQVEVIKKLKSGARLRFENIVVSCPSCQNFIVQPFVVYIK
jgi:hypothetical protein